MTDQELRDLVASIATMQAEAARQEEKRAEERKEVEEELAEERRKTERVIRQVNKQLGELGNKFGSFTEGMAWPSMRKLLLQDFEMNFAAPRQLARMNGRTLELDALAYDDGTRNEVYVVEVKSHLTQEGIEQLLNSLAAFPTFYPHLRDRKLYGIIAAVDISDALRQAALKRGLYVARINDDTFKLSVP